MMAVVRVERYESIRHYDGEDERGAGVAGTWCDSISVMDIAYMERDETIRHYDGEDGRGQGVGQGGLHHCDGHSVHGEI